MQEMGPGTTAQHEKLLLQQLPDLLLGTTTLLPLLGYTFMPAESGAGGVISFVSCILKISQCDTNAAASAVTLSYAALYRLV